MSPNTRYLLTLWLTGIALGVLATVQLAGSLSVGKVWLVVAALAVPAGWFVFTRWRVRRRIRQLLQSPSPDDLVYYWRRKLQRVRHEDLDVFFASFCAPVYIWYGDFEAAR